MKSILKTTHRLDNGYVIKKGDLIILIPDVSDQEATDLISNIREGLASGEFKSKMTLNQYQAEVQRLRELMQRIVKDYPDKLDIFDFLPLTKAGKFPVNQNPVIASSKCTTAALYYGGDNGSYPEKLTVQLRLMPYYADDMAFVRNRPMEDVRIVRLDWFDTLKKRPAVFDETGVPAKPIAQAKTSYLKDADVKPGYVYEEKSGAQFLCLDGMEFGSRHIFIRDGKQVSYDNSIHHRKSGYHLYLRWTKKLANAMAGKCDFNSLAHIMSNNDREDPWTYAKLSIREAPRKFVKEIGQVIDPSLTHAETYQKGDASVQEGMLLEYFLFDNNTVPNGWAPPQL